MQCMPLLAVSTSMCNKWFALYIMYDDIAMAENISSNECMKLTKVAMPLSVSW